MKSAEQEFFTRNGYLHRSGFHPRNRLIGLRRRLLQEIKVASERAGTSKSLRKLPIFQQIGRLSSLIDARDAHETLVTPDLIELVGYLAGQRSPMAQETQLLLSPPRQGMWTLAGLNWHVDVHAEKLDRVPGVQTFFLIDDVAPHGGATLALAGSHRLGPSGASSLQTLREILRLNAGNEAAIQAMGVQVVEMSGHAGDVFLMDMRVLHSPSINDSEHVRVMATCRCRFDK
jgi:hypothetical protein